MNFLTENNSNNKSKDNKNNQGNHPIIYVILLFFIFLGSCNNSMITDPNISTKNIDKSIIIDIYDWDYYICALELHPEYISLWNRLSRQSTVVCQLYYKNKFLYSALYPPFSGDKQCMFSLDGIGWVGSITINPGDTLLVYSQVDYFQFGIWKFQMLEGYNDHITLKYIDFQFYN